MAEHSTRPVGMAMWGGRRPEDVGEPRAIHPVTENEHPPEQPVESPARYMLSLVLVIVAYILITVGAGLLFGVGGAVLGAGLVTLIIGIMLGLGDDS